jgi:hypothetical protein
MTSRLLRVSKSNNKNNNMIALMTLLFVGALKLQVSQSYPIIFETSANDRQVSFMIFIDVGIGIGIDV